MIIYFIILKPYFSFIFPLVEKLTPYETSLIPLLTCENKIGQYIFPITYIQ